MKISHSLVTLGLAALLSACGGGGGTPASITALPATVSTGVFIDSPVSGINFTTATQSGKTNPKGEFSYIVGENVTFSVGNVQLPPVLGNATVTPLDIAKTTDINNQVVSNILVFLQSLDEDGDPVNGIAIPDAAAARATTSINFNVTPTLFTANSAVADLVFNSGSVNKTLVTEAVAKAHFQSTLLGMGGTAIDDLTPSLGTVTKADTSMLCGYSVGSKQITGKVTSVHDGDTITIDGVTKVRLDAIDAPELSQSYGGPSQMALSNMLLGGTVRVAYTKIDRYGRTVGSVFTAGCDYVNLRQVASGMAWFYKAYQCEVPSTVRGVFVSAQDSAISSRTGLWSDLSPEAPWMFRNGVEPSIPVCKDTAVVAPVIPPAVVAPVTPPSTSGCYMVFVKGYYRSNGTYVNSYYRRSPGCA